MLTEDNARKFLVKNIRYIMHQKDIKTQKDLANKLNVSQATMATIMKEDQTPTVFPFLVNLSNISGYTIEELIGQDIEASEQTIVDGDSAVDDIQWQKFIGIYQLYYYDTGSFKGRENKSSKDALNFGILVIYKDHARGGYYCIAQFGLNRSEMNERFSNCNNRFNRNGAMDNVLDYLRTFRFSHMYKGNIELSNEHVYLSVALGDKDHAHIILHRPNSASNRYIGGLGCMVSASKGRSSSPCMQILGISRFDLDVSEEELARRLLLGYPSIKAGDKIGELMKLMHSLMHQKEQQVPLWQGDEVELSDVHKEHIIRAEITRIITDVVENNLFRVMKISEVDDDDWYHYVKTFDPRRR